MIFLLANWRWLLPTAALAIALVWGGLGRMGLSNLKTEIAENALKATEAARAQDAKNAMLAGQIDQAHLERNDAIEKASTVARDLARARGLYVKARSQCVPGAPTDSGHSENGTTQVRLDDETSNALIAIARDGDRAAAYAQSCHAWALSVGK